jgi:flagellar protein FlaG
MEVLQTTAKIQQSQILVPKTLEPTAQSKPASQHIQNAEVDNAAKASKTDSQRDMDRLIEQLNRSLDPFNTTLRFGFDNSSKDFYVSVIDTKTNHMLRRFPVEQAELLLPKMQEVNGLLFDQKG